MATILAILILVPSPVPKPPALAGTWILTWGTIKPYNIDFHVSGELYSDEPWGDGRWAIDEQGRYLFSDKTGIWIIRIDDWRTLTGVGDRVNPDGTFSCRVVVKLVKRQQ